MMETHSIEHTVLTLFLGPPCAAAAPRLPVWSARERGKGRVRVRVRGRGRGRGRGRKKAGEGVRESESERERLTCVR